MPRKDGMSGLALALAVAAVGLGIALSRRPKPETPFLELGDPVTIQSDATGRGVLVLQYATNVAGAKTWRKVSGPGGVSFVDTGDREVTMSLSLPGEYEVELTIEAFNGVDVVTDTKRITVAPPQAPVIAAVRVTPGSGAMLVGDVRQLMATCIWSDGVETDCTAHRDTLWASSNPAAISVNGTGLITGAGAGAATITATHLGKSGSSDWTVAVAPPPVRIITGHQPNGIHVPPGEIWEMRGVVTSPPISVIVEGELRAWGANGPVDFKFLDIDNRKFVGGPVFNPETDIGFWARGTGWFNFRGTPKRPWGFGVQSDPTWLPTDDLREAPFRFSEILTDTNIITSHDRGFKRYIMGNPLRTLPERMGRKLPVFNLTRDVKISGTPTPNGHSHIHIESSHTSVFDNVEMSYLGPFRWDDQGRNVGILGRYGIHFHKCGDGSRGSVVTNCVMKHCGTFAWVRHMSNGVLLENNILYDGVKDAHTWDPKTLSVDAPTRGCVVAWLRNVRSPPPNNLLVGLSRLTGFDLNLVDRGDVFGCLVVGIEGGGDASGYEWGEDGVSTILPSFWNFGDNMVLACRGWGVLNWQNTEDAHEVPSQGRLIIINCDRGGIKHGAYRNGFQFGPLEIYQEGNAVGARITANTHKLARRPDGYIDAAGLFQGYNQAWENVLVRGGRGGMEFGEHVLPAEIPVLLKNWDIQGTWGKKVVVDEMTTGPAGGVPGLWDIVTTNPDIPGIRPEDVDLFNPKEGMVIRIQHLNEAWRMDHLGVVTPIAPFYLVR